VQIVGVNTDEGYWKIRNNWGQDWGESGYIRLALGMNLCGITTDPHFTHPVLVLHDTLTVQDVKADNLPVSIFNTVDSYVVFVLGSQTYTLNVVQNNKSPSWPDSFQINWDGISDLKVFMHDSNWFYPDASLGSLQIKLDSTTFPEHQLVPVSRNFDDSQATISFSLRLNPQEQKNEELLKDEKKN
jgi:Ca2+-dependent lipid-binding protein